MGISKVDFYWLKLESQMYVISFALLELDHMEPHAS